MYITGTLLRFKPVIVGGVLLWVAVIVAFNVTVIDQYLVAGVAIALGYLVPGYMLKKAES